MENNNQKMLKITLFCFFVGILGIGIYNNQDGPVKSGLNSEIINKEIKHHEKNIVRGNIITDISKLNRKYKNKGIRFF